MQGAAALLVFDSSWQVSLGLCTLQSPRLLPKLALGAARWSLDPLILQRWAEHASCSML